MVIDIDKIMDGLDRNVFASELDFTIRFAQSINVLYPGAQVLGGYSPHYKSSVEKTDSEMESRIHIDLLIIYDKFVIPVELKYRTQNTIIKNFIETTEFFPINLVLSNHSAHDYGCYGFIRDIYRVYEFIEKCEYESPEGYAVFLTNDEKYKRHPRTEKYNEFIIDDYILGHQKIRPKLLGYINGKSKEIEYQIDDSKVVFSQWKKWKDNGFFYTKAQVTK